MTDAFVTHRTLLVDDDAVFGRARRPGLAWRPLKPSVTAFEVRTASIRSLFTLGDDHGLVAQFRTWHRLQRLHS